MWYPSENGTEMGMKESERLLWNFVSGICVYSDNTRRGHSQLKDAIEELAAFIDGKANRPGAVMKLLERRGDFTEPKTKRTAERKSAA
jgi:hypothetical protein